MSIRGASGGIGRGTRHLGYRNVQRGRQRLSGAMRDVDMIESLHSQDPGPGGARVLLPFQRRPQPQSAREREQQRGHLEAVTAASKPLLLVPCRRAPSACSMVSVVSTPKRPDAMPCRRVVDAEAHLRAIETRSAAFAAHTAPRQISAA